MAIFCGGSIVLLLFLLLFLVICDVDSLEAEFREFDSAFGAVEVRACLRIEDDVLGLIRIIKIHTIKWRIESEVTRHLPSFGGDSCSITV